MGMVWEAHGRPGLTIRVPGEFPADPCGRPMLEGLSMPKVPHEKYVLYA